MINIDKLTPIFPFLRWSRMVNLETIKADIAAGFTGAIIVLPQGVAFAVIAGLPPQYGLYTAMITPIVAAMFGSSHHLVSGPTTAISIVVFTSVSHHATPGSPEFIQLALTMTFLAGVYQLSFGVARLGALVNFVSHTVVVAFTAGAAILIITSQLKHILGLQFPKGDSFLSTWVHTISHIHQANPYLFVIALVAIISASLVKMKFPKAPHLLVGLVLGSLTAAVLKGFTGSIAFIGEIPAHLPPVSAPEFSLKTLKALAPDAFAIALLGLIEAVSISRAVATKSNQRINASQEFIGQGLSNMVGSFFSSYAGSGSFTRSGINYSAGAKTPMSAIFAAMILMVIVLAIAPLSAYLPKAAMGGIILIVGYKLIDFHHIRQIFQYSKSETAVMLVTFFSTLLLELEFAIYLGVLLSIVLFLARTSTPNIPTLSVDETEEGRKLINIQKKPLKQCPQLKIIRIDMAIYFGSINFIQNRINHIVENERIYNILIVSSGINFIDLSGAEALITENDRLSKLGGGLYFVGLKSSVYEFVAKTHFVKRIGHNNFFDNKKDAIRSIYRRLDRSICETCQAQIFKECKS